MRCDTVRELFEDIEGRRAGACLEAEVRDHLAACAPCEAEYSRHREMVAALQGMNVPALPPDLADRLARRIEIGAPPPPSPSRFRRMRRRAVVAGFAAASLVALAVVGWSGVFGESQKAETRIAVNAFSDSQPGDGGLSAALAGRSCGPDSSDTRVAKGKEMDVTLSLTSNRPMQNAKVHVVLPRGLSFSAKDHRAPPESKVLTLRDNLPRGDKNYKVRVKGMHVGKWDVVALVEAGDSVVVSDTTVEVGPTDDGEETL
jgi:hypothetical protein